MSNNPLGWPTLDDVSLALPISLSVSVLMADEFGALVRLISAIAAGMVNTYTPAKADPALPDDDERLARIAMCSDVQWRSIRSKVMPYFDLRADGWHLVDLSFVRISRSSARNPIPLAIKSLALSREGQRCAYCGDEEGPFHFDHLYPVARGGTDEAHNIVVACQTCNLSKGDKTILEWVEYLRGRS